MLAMGLTGWSQTVPSTRYVIEPAQVAASLSNETRHVEAGQIKLLAQVTSAEANPQLDVLSAAPARSADAGLLVKLGCRKRSACLPFYALVESGAAASEILASGRSAVRGAGTKRPPIVMRAGTHATLRMDSPRAQINLAVVSLECGSIGSRIRVATPDHKGVYVGEVVGPNLLRGSF
jgi:hypothetical protein